MSFIRGETFGYALLNLALVASGAIQICLLVVSGKVLLPRLAIQDSGLVSLLLPGTSISALVGFALALLLMPRRHSLKTASALLIVWLSVALLLPWTLAEVLRNGDANAWLAVLISALASMLLWSAPLIFAAWPIGKDVFRNPSAQRFAYYFLGGMIGALASFSLIETRLSVAEQIRWSSVFFAGTGVLFAACLVHRVVTAEFKEQTRSPAPTWSVRIGWMVLGGLPGCVDLGATNYITTDVSPIPLVWVIPLVLSVLAWCVALARMAPGGSRATSWMVQILGVLTLFAGLSLLMAFLEVMPFEWLYAAVFIGFVCLGLLVPHAFTLPLQFAFLALVLIEFDVVFEVVRRFGSLPGIGIFMFMCAIVDWGCFGDAVKGLDGADRLPEFLLWTQLGGVICRIVYLSASLCPPSWGVFEFPLAVGAALLIRLVPRIIRWRRLRFGSNAV